MKNKISLFILSFLVISLIPLISAECSGNVFNRWDCGWKLVANAEKSLMVGSAQECFDVRGSKSYFVPTKTNFEWLSFYNSKTRLGVTINSCMSEIYSEAIDVGEEMQVPSVIIGALVADSVSGAAPSLTAEQLAIKNALITLAQTTNQIESEEARLSWGTEIFHWYCGDDCNPNNYRSQASYTAEEWAALSTFDKDTILAADTIKSANQNLDSLDIQQTAAQLNVDSAYSNYNVHMGLDDGICTYGELCMGGDGDRDGKCEVGESCYGDDGDNLCEVGESCCAADAEACNNDNGCGSYGQPACSTGGKHHGGYRPPNPVDEDDPCGAISLCCEMAC